MARFARPRGKEPLPIVLDRRRTYVLPTRFGWVFLLLVGVMAAGALNYNNNPALLLAFVLGGAGLASCLMAHLQISGLRLEGLAAEPVAAGEPLHLRLAFASADSRPRAGLQLRLDAARGMVGLPASGSAIAELVLPTHTRGWYQPGRIEVYTTRPLGLARAFTWLRPDTALLVYPASESDTPPLPETLHQSSQRRVQHAGDDPHLLRNYQPGDALRSIAWKASARRDQLLARTWEASYGDDVTLDWFALHLPHEARIRRLAAWVNAAERQGRRWLLRLPDQTCIGPGSGSEHLHACLRALALLPEASDA